MKEEKQLDLVIIGAGPAGLTAAIYAIRAKLNTLVLENELVGGQIRETYTVENFPGFNVISGADLADKMEEHAASIGVNIDQFSNIEKIKLSDDEKIIETEDVIYKVKALIIATGAKSRRLPIPEEEKLHGKVIHYCELCDGALYQGKDLVVVGGGNSAVEAAIFLTKYARNITIVHQFDYLQAQKYSQDELFKHKNVKIIWDSEIRNIVGENEIEKIVVENVKTKQKTELKADGVFVYIGYEPKTELFKDSININKWGYIETDENMETNIKGVFAAGDVRSKLIRQLTTAVSDGTVAALMAEKYIGGK
ncbi:34.2 kDa protein in rubredoxin operon [Clostridium pasteurianum DSM 525 = ATCC 6013]|uniref:34.2 kDa protein in rubredoxin operon n=2 Tax=Clostridium pasteurianum TaxID=1501 RepID=R34K_CLOPA|nr:thioredoxin-disulfide reductase [Clostridium pasteurianum]P23160.1 RecName: Full=34.2 kDa protein in rubredoxin operon; AltName: Full=ORF A [Clostridium pasteurianum]AAA23276.1 product homologous to E.coli thioredoxin reductase: J.Biol.Chem. (1988) 263:9015-9019, and to F52a protein of alkyl hydroperoxide reductase from S.typhimurium: J.Biol.Chem. (1990) 265:10535-10540; open reading frame A [Clostridium pasteurianum]AJA49848.1 34.2 kDa protein in rubredoxin operon [Clostridium pasteurianum D